MSVVGLNVKTLVGRVEARLCDDNKASESWPMGFELWAPEIAGPQIETMSAIECVQPAHSFFRGEKCGYYGASKPN